jgi:hypothetical protein
VLKEETTTEAGSVFARVLGGFMEERGIPATPESFARLAEKAGLDVEVFRARLDGDMEAVPGELSGVAGELGLYPSEMMAVAVAYTFEKEPEPTGSGPVPEREPERVARPEDVIEDAKDRIADNVPMPSPARCTHGSKSRGDQCPREATVWVSGGGERRYPLCDEHKLVQELGQDCFYWELAQTVVEDWQKMADAWKHEDLEQMVINVAEDVKEEYVKAQARYELAREVADAPRKGAESPDITRDQREELGRRIARADALQSAYCAIEDAPEDQWRESARLRALGVLAEERDHATEEAHQYKRELGFKED